MDEKLSNYRIMNNENVEVLRKEVKHSCEELFTFVIEKFYHKKTKEIKESDLYNDFKINGPLKVIAYDDSLSDIKYGFEYTQATSLIQFSIIPTLLKSNNIATQELKDKISSIMKANNLQEKSTEIDENENEDTEDIVDSSSVIINNEEIVNRVVDELKKEKQLLKELKKCRNECYGHDTNLAPINVGDIYDWIKKTIKYIESISSILDILIKIDDNYFEIKSELNDIYYSNFIMYKKSCFIDNEIGKTYYFLDTPYIINYSNQSEFGDLILKMIKKWDEGIKYLRYGDKDEFEDVLKSFYGTGQTSILIKYREQIHFLKDPSLYNQTDNIYMALIYLVYPQIGKIYWRGSLISEKYFATRILDNLIKVPSGTNINDKVMLLKNKIEDSNNLNSDYIKKKSYGINYLNMCKNRILSSYFANKKMLFEKDNKEFEEMIFIDKEGLKYARAFENTIVNYKRINANNYEEKINIIQDLIYYMRGRVTYSLPYNAKVDGLNRDFNDFDEFMIYFKNLINTNISKAVELMHILEEDENFKTFCSKSEM